MRYDIRTREFDFRHAPELDGETAWYCAALLSRDGEHLEKSPTRHRRALDAAVEAAALDHVRPQSERPVQGRAAYVGCEHPEIERPAGAMSGYMYVSYRPRFAGPKPPRLMAADVGSVEKASAVLRKAGLDHLVGRERRQAVAWLIGGSPFGRAAVVHRFSGR